MEKQIYPKQHLEAKIYIKVPVQIDGKWFAYNVNENGKAKQPPIYRPFEGRHSCNSYCNTSNEFHGWSKDQVKQILKDVGYVQTH